MRVSYYSVTGWPNITNCTKSFKFPRICLQILNSKSCGEILKFNYRLPAEFSFMEIHFTYVLGSSFMSKPVKNSNVFQMDFSGLGLQFALSLSVLVEKIKSFNWPQSHLLTGPRFPFHWVELKTISFTILKYHFLAPQLPSDKFGHSGSTQSS